MTTKTLNIAIDSRLAVSGAEQVSRSLKQIQAQAAATVRATEAMAGSFAKLGASANDLNAMLRTIGVSAQFTRMAAGVNAFEQSLVRTKASAAAAAAEIERMERAGQGLGRGSGRQSPGLVMPRPKGVADFNTEMDQGVRSSGALTNSFGRLTAAAGGLNGILATMGISAAFTQMVTTMATFEQKMSGVKAVTKASAEEMQRLEKSARALGAATSFSATQAAEGMTFLGQAGFTTSQIIESMEPVLNLAAAGAMDLGKASEIASAIMGGFRLQASDMANISDVLAAAAAAGALSVEDMGFSMKYVGPIAASLGVSLEDTAAAMVVLSNSGIKGEQAGTALRGILASLLDPSKEAQSEIQKLGLTFDDISPKSNSLAEIMKKLQGAGIDTAMAFKLFGQEGAPAISILAANNAGLAKTATDMKNVSGEAKRMADVMNDNLAGDWKNLTGAVEELTLAIGEGGMLGALRSVTQTATGLVRVWAGMGDTLGEQRQYYENLATVVEAVAVTIGTVYAGRALGALIARGAEAVTSQMALATATRAAAQATAASTAVESAAAAAAVARAQANVAGAQAALQMAVAQDKGTGAMTAQRAAAAQLAAAHAGLLSAKGAATAAEAAHGAAIAATTVRARAAAVAMRVLSTALAFFGGPIGLAITAIGGAIYYLQQRTNEAAKAQVTYNDRLDKLRSINASLTTASGTRRNELENERKQILANADAEYELAKARLEGLKAFQAAGKQSFVDTVDEGLKKITGSGVNDVVAKVGELPGMGLLGKITGASVSDMQLETTPKQIADMSGALADLEAKRASLREEASKPIPAFVPGKGAATGSGAGAGGEAGGGGGRASSNPENIKDTNDKINAFDQLLSRYGDETAALESQANAYGKSAQEVDKHRATYELWNAAREAGLQKDETVIANIDAVSTQYAASQQALRDLAQAEKDKNAAMEEAAQVTAAAATPLERYQAQLERLQTLHQQYIDTNGEMGISQETFTRSVDTLKESLGGEGEQIFDATRTSAEQYEIELQKLREQLELYIQTNGEAGISQETFNRALQDLDATIGSSTPGLDALAKSIPDMAAAFDQAATGALLSFEDALVDIVTGSKSAKEAFADMAKAIAADLARMAIRMAIIQPLAMMFGGGGGAGMAAGAIGSVGGGIYHTGGIVGSDKVPTRPFATWPKYHTGGLASNETPAILQKGEGVFTKNQMAALAPVSNQNNTSAPTIIVNVQQSQGGDPGAANQQGQMIAKQVEMAMQEFTLKNQRNGGMFNPNGGY